MAAGGATFQAVCVAPAVDPVEDVQSTVGAQKEDIVAVEVVNFAETLENN